MKWVSAILRQSIVGEKNEKISYFNGRFDEAGHKMAQKENKPNIEALCFFYQSQIGNP